jgi:hypothetical protein
MILEPLKIKHSIDTAILRTSTEVHREAYDVMIKSNEFVLVKTTHGLPIAYLVPVVTWHEDLT